MVLRELPADIAIELLVIWADAANPASSIPRLHSSEVDGPEGPRKHAAAEPFRGNPLDEEAGKEQGLTDEADAEPDQSEPFPTSSGA